MFKSKEEMDEIKHKISIANIGKNNSQSKQIKALNVITNEVIHFDTLHAACQYFNHVQKSSFVNHCENKAKYLWRKEWTFAYEENEFNTNLGKEHDRSLNKGTKVKLIDLNTNEEQTFNSLNRLNSYLGKRKGELKFTNNECLYKNYKIIKL